MKPTQVLMNEHRVIERVLLCLERMADQFVEAGRIETEPAEQAVVFLRGFADRCHHGKEEERLFPALEAKGFSPDAGPTAVMRVEHSAGREYLRRMDQGISSWKNGGAGAVEEFAEAARGYAELLSQHIRKEDLCLFPAADRALNEKEQERLLQDFHHVEEEEMGAGVHERYLAIADQLAERYGIPKAAPDTHEGGCRHCA